jgi:hypothetical protein
MKVTFKMGSERFQVDFTLTPTKGGSFAAIAKSLKDLETLQRAIPMGAGGDDLIGKIIAGQIEKQTKLPIDVDYDYRGAGFGFKIDMYSLVKSIK